jgi:hypothetical protein
MKDTKIVYPPARCIVGKSYEVPHVVLVNGKLIPILGDAHEDREFFPLASRHWHVDHRFTTNRQQAFMMPNLSLYVDDFFECFEAFKKIGNVVWDITDPTFPESYELRDPRCSNGEIVYKTSRCKRKHTHLEWEHLPCSQESSAASFDTKTPLIELRSAFCGKTLVESNGEYFCPHKGTKVDVKNINSFGDILCPAHLLKFNAKTLKAI